MSLTLPPIWKIDGNPMPRNPDDFEFAWDKANVTYEPQADGTQLRVQAPKLLRGGDLTLTWSKADRRLGRFITQYLGQTYPLPGTPHQITMDGIQPPLQVFAYIDTPKMKMSKDIFTRKIGEGGVLQDLTVTLRLDGQGVRSLNVVPAASSTAAQVKTWFGGAIGTAMDNLPLWNGQQWKQALTGSDTLSISNIGNQLWWPKIRVLGPFSSFAMTEKYADVDGTGYGVTFTWKGPSVADGDYILFDSDKMRCWRSVSGVLSEVYTFEITTALDGQAFGFWPGISVGSNNMIVCTSAGVGADTAIDFSNNSTETFRYWM